MGWEDILLRSRRRRRRRRVPREKAKREERRLRVKVLLEARAGHREGGGVYQQDVCRVFRVV